MENKYKNSSAKKKNSLRDFDKNNSKQTRSRVLSLAQLLSRVRKQRGRILAGLSQKKETSSIQSSSIGPNMQNAQSRNFQMNSQKFGVGVGYSYSYSNYEQKSKGRYYDQNFSNQRDRMVLSASGGITKAQMRIESQKEEQKRQKPIKPIIPPKSLVIFLREKPEKIIYNRRIIDYKHCGLLQQYIGLGGKILPRRQTRLTAKQQRYIAKTIKSARIMGLLPFVSKEKGYFR